MMVYPFSRSETIPFLCHKNAQENQHSLPAICREKEVNTVILHFRLVLEIGIDLLPDHRRSV